MFAAENLYCHLTLRNGVQSTFVLLGTDFVGTKSKQARSLSEADAFAVTYFKHFTLKLTILYSSQLPPLFFCSALLIILPCLLALASLFYPSDKTSIAQSK